MRSLNIWLVTETFPPEINGVAMTLSRIVQGLCQRGHRLTVVTPTHPERADGLQPEGHTLRMVPGLPLPHYQGLRFGLFAGGQLESWWKAEKPDLVHIATEGPLGWSAVWSAQKLAQTYITSFHTQFHHYSEHYGFGALQFLAQHYFKAFHGKAARTFVPSAETQQELEEMGLDQLAHLGRGVDTQLFHPARRSDELRASWGASPATPVALYVGRIALEKNLPLTVEAWQKMRQRLPELKLVMVGDGPMRAELEKKYPEIHFAGMHTGEALATHYASGDCFLFASTSETYGNVVAEAMASGLVVLGYDYAAPGRLINGGEAGFLAPFADQAAYLTAADQLAKARAQWASIGQAAREAVIPVSWEAVLDKFEAHLLSIVTPSASDPATS